MHLIQSIEIDTHLTILKNLILFYEFLFHATYIENKNN